MATLSYQLGDLVYAAEDIFNDGGMPGIDDAEGLIVPAGTRGVVVNFGFAKMDETREVYLIRFENSPDAILGDPVGCLPEELTQESPVPESSLSAGDPS